PGDNERVYRERMAEGLEGMARSLRLAQGPSMNGAFRVRFYAIHGAASDLRDKPLDQPVEAAVAGALRAAHSAAAEIAQDRLAVNATLQEQLQQFDQAVRVLDRERGALHRLAAARA